MSTVGWAILIIGVLIVAVLVATPQGRGAIKGFVNGFGSGAKLASDKMNGPELQEATLKAGVDQDVRKNIEAAIEGATRADQIIKQDAADRKELADWQSNLEKAKATFLRLTSDATPDDQQIDQIGQAKAYGATALQKVQSITGLLEGNAANVVWAQDAVKRAETLMASIPAEGQKMIQEGHIAACAQLLAQSEQFLAQSQIQGFGTASSNKLDAMKAAASQATSRAEMYRKAAAAAPKSADAVRQGLNNLAGGPSDFEAFCKQ